MAISILALKLKPNQKSPLLTSLYLAGSSESYFCSPAHFHTPPPLAFFNPVTLLPGVIWSRRANGGKRVEIDMKGGKEKLHLQKKERKKKEKIEVAAILRFTLPTSTLKLRLRKKIQLVLKYGRLSDVWVAGTMWGHGVARTVCFESCCPGKFNVFLLYQRCEINPRNMY